jgi:hypothetical protein
MAWAYEQLGDRKRALDWLDRGLFSTLKGLRAELLGEDETAIRDYLEALHWGKKVPPWLAYAKLRLRGMEARLGKPAVARLKKAVSDEQEQTRTRKIVLKSIEEFHARFSDIAAAVRQYQGITTKPVPMSDEEIAKLRLPSLRGAASPTVPVPRSVRTILRTDRNFCLWEGAAPLLAAMKPVNVEKLVRRALRGEDTGLGPLARLPATVPVWTDAPDMPACIKLSSPGDQALLLYMGVPDADGEYPVARFDDQPELWISNASLVHYVLDAAKDVVSCKIDHVKAKKDAQKRNARYREGWSEHPTLKAALAKF